MLLEWDSPKSKILLKIVTILVAEIFLFSQIVWAADWQYGRFSSVVPRVGGYDIHTWEEMERAQEANIRQLNGLKPPIVLDGEHDETVTAVITKVSKSLMGAVSTPDKVFSIKRIKSFINWLKKPATRIINCAVRAVKNFLRAKGRRLSKEKEIDIASKAIVTDALSGVIAPENDQGDLRLSMSSIATAAKVELGKELYGAKNITMSELRTIVSSEEAVIAHVGGNHYVVVSAVTEEEVTYIDADDKEHTKTLDEFESWFTGNILTTRKPEDRSKLMKDNEMQQVKGADMFSSYSLSQLIDIHVAYSATTSFIPKSSNFNDTSWYFYNMLRISSYVMLNLILQAIVRKVVDMIEETNEKVDIMNQTNYDGIK